MRAAKLPRLRIVTALLAALLLVSILPLVAMAQGTPTSVRNASNSRAPGRG